MAGTHRGRRTPAIRPITEGTSYPVTAAEFVARHGDRGIERTDAGPITIQALSGPMDDDTTESMDGARESVLPLMPKGSGGRQRYPDWT